jgi:hypothetical protein
MNYELKDKLIITKELLETLESKGWQEIEYLQAQIANLADSSVNDKLRQLLKSLLTSYYVFTGGIETLTSEPINTIVEPIEKPIQEPVPELSIETTSNIEDNFDKQDMDLSLVNEPTVDIEDNFEYFVDFDDPVGEPLTDDDLYNN